MTEITPSCPAGSGECPVECPIYFAAVNSMPPIEEIDPYMMRLSLLFADAFNHEIKVVDIANVLSRCMKETGRNYLQELSDNNQL